MTTKFALGLMALTLYMVAAMTPVAAVASNEPELTYPTGTVLETGSKVRAVNVGETSLTSSEGTLACSSSAMTGSLTKNSGGSVEATIENASFNSGGTCNGGVHESVHASPSENGVPWCFRSTPELKDHEFQIRGGSCSKAVTPIRLGVRKMIKTQECVYENAESEVMEPITGTYSTDPSEAILTSNNGPFSRLGEGGFCLGFFELDSSYTFETLEGSPLSIAAGPSLTKLSPGTKVRGKGSVQITTFVNVTCSSELVGTLKENSGTKISIDIEEASIYGPSTWNTCPIPIFGNQKFTFNSVTNGLPWCLQATSEMAADEFQIRGNNCASEARPIRLTTDTYQTFECLYERKAALAGTYTTHPKDAVLTFENAVFLEVGAQAACPDQTQLDSSMTLERDIEGSQPLYFS